MGLTIATRRGQRMSGPLFTTPFRGQLVIRGELDLLAVPELEAWLGRFDGQRCEVDMSGVTFFDSCALRTFLNARRENTNLVIVRPSVAVINVLQLTGTAVYLAGGRDAIW
jgi:anti-anti-sigma factor